MLSIWDFLSFSRGGGWTIYLEELQWLASYRSELIAALKLVWDNELRKSKRLKVILCGSSPSFFLNEVIRSRALYNRTTLEIRLDDFPITEARFFLPKPSLRSFFDSYLTVGGIPVYLERLKSKSSPLLSLCENSFTSNGFFVEEINKIFVSTFGTNPLYRKIIEAIARAGSMTREQLVDAVAYSSGGTLTNFVADLELCGFIRKVTPIGKSRDSLVSYLQIQDPYLHFYYHFIHPKATQIRDGAFDKNPSKALNNRRYTTWLGFAFERFCRRNAHRIAEILGFSAVDYEAGSFFNRRMIEEQTRQIDLIYRRADRVYTVCEIKYTEAPQDITIIPEFEEKLAPLKKSKSHTLHKVLITASGISEPLAERGYFDRVLRLEDLV